MVHQYLYAAFVGGDGQARLHPLMGADTFAPYRFQRLFQFLAQAAVCADQSEKPALNSAVSSVFCSSSNRESSSR